jgi:hypothetical protein
MTPENPRVLALTNKLIAKRICEEVLQKSPRLPHLNASGITYEHESS